MPECENQHPELPITCEKENGHKDNHQRALKSGVITWEQVVVEKVYTREQLLSMVDQHSDMLQQTLDSVQRERSDLGYVTRTFVPILQIQLDIIKKTLQFVEARSN